MARSKNRFTAAINPLRGAFLWTIVFSFCINLLMLTLPLYLLQVFDRVLTSRSLDTLWVLSAMAVVALIAYGLMEGLRRMMLTRMGVVLEAQLGAAALDQAIRAAPSSGGQQSAQGISELQMLRGYLGGQALLPLLDAPWSLLFLVVIFLLHPLIAWIAVAAFFLLGIFALLNERLTRNALLEGRRHTEASARQAEHAIENSEAVLAMGMGPAIVARWRKRANEGLGEFENGTRRLQLLSSLSRVLRQLVQVVVLATGALLAIDGAISPGAMIASSILVTRALAPVEQLIGSWGQTVAARGAWQRLRDTPWPADSATASTTLPVPKGHLHVENLTYVPPGLEKPTLSGVSFDLKPGESLGLIGPTGSGKTTLARCLLGVLRPRLGEVRLDGVGLADWNADDLGQYVGYVPQDLELFSGTIAENIARFGGATDASIVEAAQLAGAHETILKLPSGYDTPVGPRGVTLSGGQRQSLALARALLGNIRLAVLDEPNANQDRTGEEALLSVLRELKHRGVTSVIIAHRPAIIRYVDRVLVLRDGKATHFGPRDEVLASLAQPTIKAGASAV